MHCPLWIQVPSGYNATLQSHIRKEKLARVKLHDHHIVLIQWLISAAIRHMLKLGPRER